jgi:hypothetical protein
VLTLKQSGNITPSVSTTYPLTLFNNNVQNLSIGSDASYVYLQTWASKPLNLNPQGNAVLVSGGLTTSPLNLYQFSTTKFGMAIGSGELRQYVASNSLVGHTFGTLSTVDGITYTPLVTIRTDGSIKPVQLADASAPNHAFYYSTTAGKLVYKDGSGVVNALY